MGNVNLNQNYTFITENKTYREDYQWKAIFLLLLKKSLQNTPNIAKFESY